MITKSKLAIVGTLVAASFATPAFAQSVNFSGAESTALSAYFDLPAGYWDHAQTVGNNKNSIRGEGYNARAQVQDRQTVWPSAAALGSLR
jgi:hypothetical protein